MFVFNRPSTILADSHFDEACTREWWRKRLRACSCSRDGSFQHLLWLSDGPGSRIWEQDLYEGSLQVGFRDTTGMFRIEHQQQHPSTD